MCCIIVLVIFLMSKSYICLTSLRLTLLITQVWSRRLVWLLTCSILKHSAWFKLFWARIKNTFFSNFAAWKIKEKFKMINIFSVQCRRVFFYFAMDQVVLIGANVEWSTMIWISLSKWTTQRLSRSLIKKYYHMHEEITHIRYLLNQGLWRNHTT